MNIFILSEHSLLFEFSEVDLLWDGPCFPIIMRKTKKSIAYKTQLWNSFLLCKFRLHKALLFTKNALKEKKLTRTIWEL